MKKCLLIMILAPSLAWPQFAIGRHRGGTTPVPIVPVIRTSVIQASTGTPISLAWPTTPTTCQVGDLALIFYGGGYQISSQPTGWTIVSMPTGTFYDGAVFSKIVATGDTSSPVTVTPDGAFDAVTAMVCFVGPTGGVRENSSQQSGHFGSNTVTRSTSSAVLSTDLVFLWGSSRTVTSINIGSLLQSANSGTDSYAVLNTLAPPGGVVTAIFSFVSGTNGSYVSIVVVKGS